MPPLKLAMKKQWFKPLTCDVLVIVDDDLAMMFEQISEVYHVDRD